MAKGTNPGNLDLSQKPWRLGTHNNVLVYADMQTGDHYDDVYLGSFQKQEWAQSAIDDHNKWLRYQESVNDD